jgi:NADH dehydrogenase/NADH:ubiquinone oxidoreductase subunit G
MYERHKDMSADNGQAEQLTITIDGDKVPFREGETIYEIAARHGKTIPSLCYDPRLEPFGGCRLCVVEIEGIRNPVASCTAKAADGMVVNTATDKVESLRKTLLEMVASENTKIDVDPLRGYASQELTSLLDRYQARTGRFAGAHSGQSKFEDDNPFLLRDYDLCISCYRCVRVCAEREGDYAISVMNRGFHTRIATEFDGFLRGSACTFCGQCVQTCPTGALADKKAMRFAIDPAERALVMPAERA